MGKARLHWFWRGAIAVVIGAVLPAWLMGVDVGPISDVFIGIQRAVLRILSRITKEPTILWAAKRLMIVMPCVVTTLIGYGLLTRYFGPMPGHNETRCRKCGYILRGITEPRCPECGERI